ncbi:MAG TPA: hypothetical protein VH370_22530 [Humisphaera sp.]|nr:hypothetical protein [Humisphaera sp.]
MDNSDLDDLERSQAWAGEIRVNLVRLVAIALFYGRHLIEVMLSPAGSAVRGRYHLAVTMLVVLWAFECVVLHRWLTQRIYADWMKFAAVLWDAGMITCLCAIAGGARTPLVLLYFPLIASATLRMSLRLVYVTTAAAMLGYLFLLGFYAWYLVGFHKYYATPELRIPRSEEAIYLLAMLTSGAFAARSVRGMRAMTERQRSVEPSGPEAA